MCIQVAFRTDASEQIGTGHVMRCLTLADRLKELGAECQFICREHDGHLIDRIRSRAYKVNALPRSKERTPPDAGIPHAHWLGIDWQTDAEQTRLALGNQVLDWLVVDHYALDMRWESAVRSSCERIMVIDDLADRAHDCDLLVDPGVERDLQIRYQKLVSPAARVFLGPKYAILRREFDYYRNVVYRKDKFLEATTPRRLLVMFGGNDATGHTLEALKVIALTGARAVEVDVVLSVINQDRARIISFCESHRNFHPHVETSNVARLMARSDLIVGSGGGSTWERLFLRKPSLVKVVAENQRRPLESLRDMGLLHLYADSKDLETILRQAFASGVPSPPDVVRNGVSIIAEAMKHSSLQLQAPRPLDVRRTYRWIQEKDLRFDFLMRGSAPVLQEHFLYWRRLLSTPLEVVFSIYDGQRHIGNAGLRNIDRASSSAELWLYIGEKSQRGNGRGRVVLSALERVIRDKLDCRKAILHVSKRNLPAIRLYRSEGYQPSPLQDVEAVGYQDAYEVVRMEKEVI
jgi:UDP-2,4-diacetamido-2,4,6-trideoxy-beta-L-altropyranose hydrolase